MIDKILKEEDVWNKAKEEIKRALKSTAKVYGKSITYADLVAQVTAIRLDAHSVLLPKILGEVSIEEDKSGCGMLTVLIVRRGETMPVQGFFDLAIKLGRKGSKEEIWIAELKKVHEAHK